MNTNDLYTEYARCIDMCRGTALEYTPWLCLRMSMQKGLRNNDGSKYCKLTNHPDFNMPGLAFVQYCIAIVEDKPLFPEDKIYLKSPNQGQENGAVISKNNELIFENMDRFDLEIFSPHFDKFLTWQPPEPKQTKKPAYELRIIQELTYLANCNSLDVECNIPDFVIGAYLYKSLQALMEANKANGEYFKLSAQQDEAKTQ